MTRPQALETIADAGDYRLFAEMIAPYQRPGEGPLDALRRILSENQDCPSCGEWQGSQRPVCACIAGQP